MPSVTVLPSLRQLRYLVELSRTLNFRQAAETCFVTQSTLSAGIRELETLLDVQLVERDKRHVRLTAAGADVVARAAPLLAQAGDLVAAARGAREPMSGPLRLGVIPTLAPFMLPQLLPGLRERHPKLRLHLREDQTARLLDRLAAGALDIALIALPWDTGGLRVIELFRDEFWFVSRADDPLARTKVVAVEKLEPREVVLLEEGHCLRDHALAACGERERADESVVEATSLPTLLQMVEGGLGVTLLPEIAIKAGLLAGTALIARPFSRSVPARTLALVARATSPAVREAALIADFVRGERQKLLLKQPVGRRAPPARSS